MTLLYVGIALLVAAQIVGIYALKTHKADLIFALFMLMLLAGAVVCGAAGAYSHLH